MGNELDRIGQLDSDAQKQYIEQTNLNQRVIEIEETLEDGTVKITDELFKQAVFAIDSRIEATKKYTDERIARVNKNYELYYNQSLPLIRQSVDDWTDKLYKIFADFGDTLNIKTEGPALDEYISKRLSISPQEDAAPRGRLRSLLKFLLKDKFDEKKCVYYFNKKEVIKSFLKRCILKTEVKKKIEEFLRKGVISGMFCFKEGWGETKDYKVMVNKESEGSKDGDEYTSLGKPMFAIDSEPIYKLSIPDSRNLIFRPDKKEWVIEKVPTNFWKLLEDTLDEKGKAKKNAIYDIRILNWFKKMIKDTPNIMPKNKEELAKINITDISEEEMSKIYELEADMEIMEAFNIPLILNNKPTNCIVSAINHDGIRIPIRIQPSSFVRGGPIDWVEFLKKENDIGGQGLPEKLEGLDSIIQEYNELIKDNVKFAIYGITAGDPNNFRNPEKLKNLQPKDHIQLKDTKGRSIREILEWLTPPTQNIGVAFDIMKFHMDFLNAASRKGPGDKISPNPSATEASVIMEAESEPINTVGIRLNMFFGYIISNMYFYTLLNRDSRFALKIMGTKIKKGTDVEGQGLQANNIERMSKDIELARDELLVEGIQFEVEAIKVDESRQAIQKQQYMQAITTLWNVIKVSEQKQETDPATGQVIMKTVPKTYIDDTGNEVEINQFKIVTDYLDKMGITDPWKIQEKAKMTPPPGAASMPSLPPGAGPIPPKGINPPKVNMPPLNATPNNAAVLNSAIQPR
jgi:hypothetical protein